MPHLTASPMCWKNSANFVFTCFRLENMALRMGRRVRVRGREVKWMAEMIWQI